MDLTPSNPAPLIEIHDIVVHRGAGPVLDGVSLRLLAGERLAIAGTNGVGKSTLLRAVIGLERPQSGTVRLFDRATASEAEFRAARARIGFLFQDSDDQLFCPTVLEDVAFGPMNQGLDSRQAMAKARDTLERLGLGLLAERVCYRLSGGEKRLVCLAGLLAMEPDVLLLDEPTNGLDAANAARLTSILRSLESAMIIVSHDLDFLAELATRAAILRDGKLLKATVHRHPHAHDHVHIHATSDGHKVDTETAWKMQ